MTDLGQLLHMCILEMHWPKPTSQHAAPKVLSQLAHRSPGAVGEQSSKAASGSAARLPLGPLQSRHEQLLALCYLVHKIAEPGNAVLCRSIPQTSLEERQMDNTSFTTPQQLLSHACLFLQTEAGQCLVLPTSGSLFALRASWLQ